MEVIFQKEKQNYFNLLTFGLAAQKLLSWAFLVMLILS